MKYIQTPSQNFDDRRDGKVPSCIILHYTGTKTAQEAHERFIDPAPTDSIGRIAPHYMIDGAGDIFQYVQEDKRAWHAGVSYWRGEIDVNSISIGIEIWNPGHEYGYTEFLPRQIETCIGLCRGIIDRWAIRPDNILGHADIAPGRKIDPGEKMPWQLLAENGVGLWPLLGTITEQPVYTPEQFHQSLLAYGYNPAIPLETVVAAFAQHFWPEQYTRLTQDNWPQLYHKLLNLINISKI